jgi:hypothetical protein
MRRSMDIALRPGHKSEDNVIPTLKKRRQKRLALLPPYIA